MRFRYIVLVVFLFTAARSGAVTHTVTTPSFNFDPSSLNISLGDTINFSIGAMHNVVEVSQATWNANGNTPLAGGFSLPFGGGTLVLQSAGTYYYVCSPHAGGGMKGSITVTSLSISTGTLAAASYCKGASLTVPFTAAGAFNAGNVFTAQLSNSTGSFASPTAIGTLAGTTSGQIAATIPAATAVGAAYRIRVVSSSPAVTGTDNGSDLAVLDAPPASITPAGPTSFCQGQSVQLDAPTGAGFTYTWRLNGQAITGAAGPSYVATAPGQYSVVVSNGSCSTTSGNQRVVVYPTDPTTLIWTGNIDTDWSTLGNWDNPCAVPTAGDTVTVPAGLTPPASIPAITLGKFTLNNSTGVLLGGDLEIAGNLTLSSGALVLGTSNLILGPSASINGATASSFVVTDGPGALHIAGIGSGGRTGAMLFPVGSSAAGYTPLTLTNAGTSDVFSVRVADDVLDGGTAGAPIAANVVDKTWFVTEATAGGSNVTLLFEWRTADELAPFDRTASYIAHHDGAAWAPLQGLGAATGGDPYQRSVSGVTSFSPFAIGDGGSPLPVEYRTFTADIIQPGVLLRWETASETNSRGFTPERRPADEAPWTPLGFVDSRGGATAGAAYEFTDVPPSAGVWQYRLRQTDHDGSESFSSIQRVEIGENRDAAADGLSIDAAWPNPLRLSASSELTVRYSGATGGVVAIALHDLLGRRVAEVLSTTVAAGETATARLEVSSLSPGVYLCLLTDGARSAVRRLTVMR